MSYFSLLCPATLALYQPWFGKKGWTVPAWGYYNLYNLPDVAKVWVEGPASTTPHVWCIGQKETRRGQSRKMGQGREEVQGQHQRGGLERTPRWPSGAHDGMRCPKVTCRRSSKARIQALVNSTCQYFGQFLNMGENLSPHCRDIVTGPLWGSSG